MTGEKQGPVISPVNRGIPEAVAEHMVGSPDNPKVAVFMHGIGNCQSGKNGGLSRTMPSPKPTDSTVGNSPHKNCSRNSPHKNCSKPDGSEGRASSLASAVTRHWKSSSAVFSSFLGNKDLCMQAACALHHQRKFTTQSTEGGRSGCTGLSKFEAHRLAVLAEFLLDGSLARTSSLWGRYGICAHARAVDAGQKAISCQSIDKLANPSSLDKKKLFHFCLG